MTEQEIITIAMERGLKNPRITRGLGGPMLHGEGRGADGWPLVWTIVQDMGLSWGCGGTDWHQMDAQKVQSR